MTSYEKYTTILDRLINQVGWR